MKYFKFEYIGQYDVPLVKLDELTEKIADLLDEYVGTEWVGNMNSDWKEINECGE